ncbi:hypothetical protein [Hyphomicrobium sp.]|uniref:hypothetical protein n=1 Tax=Hyphomicrobium sp. TaxID=82 RepID=UPI001DC07B4A|nr:hypothetical protein [Hyphomicrobium sp.]MBY0559936.1 hypothetical protein [Hyphomicrobium sp.]
MAFHTYKLIEIPAPVRVGQGMYDAWRDDCRRATSIEKVRDYRRGDRVTVDLEVPANMDTQVALTALAWVDKLVRETAFPPEMVVFEYGLRRAGNPGQLTVKIYVHEGEADGYVRRPPEQQDAAE